jgi:hypothetical protein
MNSDVRDVLRPLVSLLGRSAFSQDDLFRLVAPKRGKTNLVKAFNLCDGTRTQADVRKLVKFDRGNFSRIVDRWIEAGILFRLGEGREARLLHVYALMRSEVNGRPKTK